ncbi:MAG TPA: hypothetical protein PLC50_06240, partial [Alicycliphilus sp.]|nr:hypothetical protein [Alicycliphilus sp.]
HEQRQPGHEGQHQGEFEGDEFHGTPSQPPQGEHQCRRGAEEQGRQADEQKVLHRAPPVQKFSGRSKA